MIEKEINAQLALGVLNPNEISIIDIENINDFSLLQRLARYVMFLFTEEVFLTHGQGILWAISRHKSIDSNFSISILKYLRGSASEISIKRTMQ